MRNLAPSLFGACAFVLGASAAASATPLTSGIAANITAMQNDSLVSVGYRYYGEGSYYRPYHSNYYGAYRGYAWSGYYQPQRYVYSSPYYSGYYRYSSYAADYDYPTYYASYSYPYYYPRYGYYRPWLGLGFFFGW